MCLQEPQGKLGTKLRVKDFQKVADAWADTQLVKLRCHGQTVQLRRVPARSAHLYEGAGLTDLENWPKDWNETLSSPLLSLLGVAYLGKGKTKKKLSCGPVSALYRGL